MGQYVVAPKGVGFEAMVGGSSVEAVEGLAEVDAAESAVATELEEVVADAVVVDYRHS